MLVFAYPLAAPIPLVPIVVFIWLERRRKIASGQPVLRVRDLYRGRISLLWIVPVAALLAVPVWGVVQKAWQAAGVLLPGQPLSGSWKGDLNHFIPFDRFLSLPNSPVAIVLVVGVLLLAIRGLVGQPRSLSWGLGGLLGIGLLLALYFRHRQYGWYFEFKLLAFIGPLLLLIATIGAAKLRSLGLACVAVLAVCTAGSIVAAVKSTGSQLPKTTIQLADWTKSLPPHASIRLDMWPPLQLWAAYFLSARPLCSQAPLLLTDYPHVPASRKADYIVASPPFSSSSGRDRRTAANQRRLLALPGEPGDPRRLDTARSGGWIGPIPGWASAPSSGAQSPGSSAESASACALALASVIGPGPSRLMSRYPWLLMVARNSECVP